MVPRVCYPAPDRGRRYRSGTGIIREQQSILYWVWGTKPGCAEVDDGIEYLQTYSGEGWIPERPSGNGQRQTTKAAAD
jgi:hypothetical protein